MVIIKCRKVRISWAEMITELTTPKLSKRYREWISQLRILTRMALVPAKGMAALSPTTTIDLSRESTVALLGICSKWIRTPDQSTAPWATQIMYMEPIMEREISSGAMWKRTGRSTTEFQISQRSLPTNQISWSAFKAGSLWWIRKATSASSRIRSNQSKK